MRNPCRSAKVGTIVSLKRHKSGPASVLILFDGRKEPSRLHWTYVERIETTWQAKRKMTGLALRSITLNDFVVLDDGSAVGWISSLRRFIVAMQVGSLCEKRLAVAVSPTYLVLT
jgi:hypothetical protein